MQPFRKGDLSYAIAHREGVTLSQAGRILDVIAESISIETHQGREVRWPGIGVFVRRNGRIVLEDMSYKSSGEQA